MFLTSCGGRTPTAPTESSPDPAPASAVATGIRIEGPSSLSLGGSAPYRVVASFSDGTTRDVTQESSLTPRAVFSDYPDVLRVAADGVATGTSDGEAELQAHYPPATPIDGGIVLRPGTLQATLRVMVLEAGTFRVSGKVSESGQPFPGVSVKVMSGRRAGRISITRDGGSYVFFGLGGRTDLVVAEEGFQHAVRSIVVNDHAVVDFSLESISGYDSLTGQWRLTIQAAASCAPGIPAQAMTRTFDARIMQRGPQLTIDLSSPARVILADYPAVALGGVAGNRVDLYFQTSMGEEHPGRWTILEALEPQRFLGIAGFFRGIRTGNVVVGTNSGRFAAYHATGATYLAPGTLLEHDCVIKTESPVPTGHEHTFRLER
jgi:hypothetical protein